MNCLIIVFVSREEWCTATTIIETIMKLQIRFQPVWLKAVILGAGYTGCPKKVHNFV